MDAREALRRRAASKRAAARQSPPPPKAAPGNNAKRSASKRASANPDPHERLRAAERAKAKPAKREEPERDPDKGIVAEDARVLAAIEPRWLGLKGETELPQPPTAPPTIRVSVAGSRARGECAPRSLLPPSARVSPLSANARATPVRRC
jgi:hypothetical protein